MLSDTEKGKALGLLIVHPKKYQKVANMVKKTDGSHPSRQAIEELFKKSRAPPRIRPPPHNKIPTTQAKKIASTAMKIKKKEKDVALNDVIRKAPTTCTNQETGNVISKATLSKIFKSFCYDDPNNKSDTWNNQNTLSKTALAQSTMRRRLAWAESLLEDNRITTPGWAFRNLIWYDPNFEVLPGSAAKFETLKYGNKKKKWTSNKSRIASRNLRAGSYAKQAGWGDVKAHWWIWLSRGKVGVVTGVPPKDIEGFLRGLDRSISASFSDVQRKPRTLFSDRGYPMYTTNGYSTQAYRDAAGEQNYTLFAGNDARLQPGNVADCLLHETAVPWIKRLIRVGGKFGPSKHGEGVASFYRRLRKAVRHVNQHYDVAGLCRQFKSRLDQLVENGGDRLKY